MASGNGDLVIRITHRRMTAMQHARPHNERPTANTVVRELLIPRNLVSSRRGKKSEITRIQ